MLRLRSFPVANISMDKNGVIKIFRPIILSHNADFFRRGTLQCVTSFGYRKNFNLQRVVTIFCQIFFVSQYRKTFQRNPSVLYFRAFPVANKIMDKRGGGYGGIKIFRRKFFSSECRKFP